jgi:SAM-dependent methyltransferase
MKFTWLNRYRLVREGLYCSIQRLRPDEVTSLLDIGCGHRPYQELFPFSSYVGIDIPITYGEGSKPNIFASAMVLPFRENTFDCILCTEVLEHLNDPSKSVREMARVLKCGGHLLVSTPFIWPVHEQPFDFQRFTFYGIKLLLDQNGLVINESVKRGGFASVVVQLFSDHLYNRGRKNKYVTAINDRLWGLFQWAAFMYDLKKDTSVYALGWTISATKPHK